MAFACLLPLPCRSQASGQPPGLIVLEERPSLQGTLILGLYNFQPVPSTPGLWRVQLWRQQGSLTTVTTDTVGCDLPTPMRFTREANRWIVRELNPGGAITETNRIDHLVWWATCHREQAGRDPASLEGLARELGFPGTLRETEQILPGRAR
jgi:hypothetical protein